MIIPVDDVTDPRLAEFASLRDAQLRTKLEAERGLFVAEGDKIIHRAWESGCTPSAFLLTEKWRAKLDDVLATTDAPCYLGTEAMIEQVSGFHVHRGALATFHRPEPPAWETFLDADRLLVAEGLVDHWNVGSILRLAAALSWDGVIVSETSADPLYRRAIKASMGAALQLPWRRMEHDFTDLQRLRDAGFTIVATTLADDSIDLDNVPTDGKLALVLGNEGHGLPNSWQDFADVRARIPMAEGIDSLNVAAAGAIAAYTLRRR